MAYLDGADKGQRAAREGKLYRIPEDMTYFEWKTIYIDKIDCVPRVKITARGLAAGDKSSATGASGISPYYIGSIDFKDAAQIKRVLDYYEPLIVKKPVEHAIIITKAGDIYHCTGTLNSLDTIVELGDKLHGAIVTHNHPVDSVNEYTFSELDRDLFTKYELTRLRGVDEFFIYELRPVVFEFGG